MRFNPRTRTGCDMTDVFAAATVTVFQSTHPHGVRQGVHHCHLLNGYQFQSTHPHGVRP